MALTSLEKNTETTCEPIANRKFGYGTEIYLDGEQTEQMGLKKMAAGQVVSVKASGIVTRCAEEIDPEKDDGGKDLSIGIQITDIEVRPVGPANALKAAEILYDKG